MIIPNDIPTALSRAEAIKLAMLARGNTVLELGAHHGFSTVVLASSARRVSTVDWFEGDVHAGLGNTYDSFMNNIRRYQVEPIVSILPHRFEDILPVLAERHPVPVFDGCFIDGQHDEESVRRDLELVKPLVRWGGWIAFHDYGRTGCDFGVTQVADEWFASKGGRYHERIDYLAWGVA